MKNCLPLLFLMVTGCQTPYEFAEPTREWHSWVGQLQYVYNNRALTGDITVQWFDRRNFQLEYTSGPGFPLLRVWREGAIARAEGVLARGAWEGRVQSAPSQLRNWFQLGDKFAAVSPKQQRANFVFPQTGERFSFHFGS